MTESGAGKAGFLALSPAERNARLTKDLHVGARHLEPLVTLSHAAQRGIHAFLEHYEQTERKGPIPPGALRRARMGSRNYLRIEHRLGEVAARYEPLATADASRLAGLEIEPALLHVGVAMSTAAAVTLYDNYLSTLGILDDDHLRRLLNEPDKTYGIKEDALWELTERLNAKGNRERLHHLVGRWIELEETEEAPGETLSLLRKTIESSVSFRYARDDALDANLPTKMKIRREKFLDGLVRLGDGAVSAVSEAFGNGIGMVETRKGKLWKDRKMLRHLRSVLHPLDILLEKTPFRLTDFFIPGHFGHAAIWMGTAQEIESLGVWEQDAMQDKRLAAYRKEIKAHACVLEALRSGVELNTLRQFSNVDDLAVLRPTHLSREEVVASLVRGFQQVGKDYDFNFDVETTGTIVCSELPYQVYPGVTWNTEQELGRFTINPDQIAEEALGENPPFELILFYRDGTLLDAADAPKVFAELVQ